MSESYPISSSFYGHHLLLAGLKPQSPDQHTHCPIPSPLLQANAATPPKRSLKQNLTLALSGFSSASPFHSFSVTKLSSNCKTYFSFLEVVTVAILSNCKTYFHSLLLYSLASQFRADFKCYSDNFLR